MSQKKIFLSVWIIFLSATLFFSPTYMVVAGSNIVQITRQIFDALFGSYVNVSNTVVAIDHGFGKATQSVTPSGTSSSSPVFFSSTAGQASTGIAAGDWVVTFGVNTTASTPASTLFTVTLIFHQGSSSSFRLYLETGPTVSSSPSFEILTEFDIGSSLSSPYSYTLSVQ